MTLTLVKAGNELEIVRQNGAVRLRTGGPGLRGLPGAQGQPGANGSPDGGRPTLAANRNYYVSKTGSDANDGLTAATAFLTVQKAVNTALSLDMLIYSVTINVGAGTFAEGGGLLVNGNGNARINIVGAGYDQTTISGTGSGLAINYGVVLSIKDLTIIGGTIGLWARYAASVTFQGTVRFSGGTSRLIGCDMDAVVGMNAGTILIDANSAFFLYCTSGGHMIFANGATFKTTAARTFSATAFASQVGIIAFTASQVTWDVSDGAVTGRRYQISGNSVIDTVTGGGSTYLPGSTDGTTATGGQYV